MLGIYLMVSVVLRLSLVANDVHPTNDLADGEETNDLRSGDTSKSDLLLVGGTNAGDDVRGSEAGVLEGGRVTEGVGQRLEVSLEGGHVAVIRIS